MLPKIIVNKFADRKDLYEHISFVEKNIMAYEGSEGKVDDLRSWILSAINVARRNLKLQIVIWDADLLSSDCQAILLKPLEELGGEIKLFLIVGSENKMLPTIVSRCIVEYPEGDGNASAKYWNEVRKCWASGPAACISFSDSLSKDDAKLMIREVIIKLKDSLETEINNKRLQVIENALLCLAELEGTNINQKLTVDNFLIGSWKLIKT
jgi:hypothetical protein